MHILHPVRFASRVFHQATRVTVAQFTSSAVSKMPPKDKYTDPKLRDEVKEELMQSDKGGAPGQWSARKVGFPTLQQLSSDKWVGSNDGQRVQIPRWRVQPA